jgi:hypothetical protein
VERAGLATAAETFEGMTAPAFLCRPDAGVVAANGAAGALLAPWLHSPYGHPCGDLLGCINAREAGCGRGPRCATCPIRLAIRRAAAGETVSRVPVAMELVRGRTVRRTELRVSAMPADRGGQRYALLTLEPAEWVP